MFFWFIFYIRYIDLTHGNSGGPAASFDANNNPFVKGIVSGAEDGFTQNALSKIKKENYYLLTDLLNNNLWEKIINKTVALNVFFYDNN